jgi:hypothetical protein
MYNNNGRSPSIAESQAKSKDVQAFKIEAEHKALFEKFEGDQKEGEEFLAESVDQTKLIGAVLICLVLMVIL